jgi:hypothetical protein
MHKAHRRRFGVEIECGMDNGVEDAADLFGFPHDDYGYAEYENGDGWTLHDDGSGVELGTPPMQGEEGYAKVRWAMDRLKGGGAFVTDYDGLHVHHDAPEFVENPALCVPLVESWLNNEDTIRQFVSPRRHSRGACPRWRDGEVENVRGWAKGENTLYVGRNDLNLLSLREHGTVEFRLLEGTLDADVAIAWIQFGQRFIHEVVRTAEALPAVRNDRDLLSRIRLSREARGVLAAKQEAGHVTPGMRFDIHPDRDYYEEDGYEDDSYA